MKVLIIDDDPSIHQLLRRVLNPLINLETSLDFPRRSRDLLLFDLVIVDLHLGDRNALEHLKNIQEEFPDFISQIILLTGGGSIESEIESHKLGLRDYVKKPFDPRVFSALIDKHLLQLKKSHTSLHYGKFRVDLVQHEAFLGDTQLEISLTEFKILRVLIESKGRIVTRERLLNDVWDLNDETQTRTVDMHISTLRKKLGSAGEFLKTKRGVGYFLEEGPA